MNDGENEKWPPKEAYPPKLLDFEAEQELKPQKQQFDGISKLLTYVVGIGLCAVLVSLFVRIVLWILGIDL